MIRVHPAAVIGEGVALGADVTVGAYATIDGPCEIGDGCWIGPHAAIGGPGQVRGNDHGPGAGAGVRIGADSVIRGFATVDQGTTGPTVIGSDAYIMAYAYVPHDARIGTRVTLCNAVQIGGHTIVGDRATLGFSSVVHQRGFIGAGAMVGMQAVVTKPVPPFATVIGCPARLTKLNRVGLRRAGVPEGLDEMIGAAMRDRAPVDSARTPGWIVEAFEAYSISRLAEQLA